MVCCLFHVVCVRFRQFLLYKELKKPKVFYPIMNKQSLYDLLEILYARKYYTDKGLIYSKVLLTARVLSRTDFILKELTKYDYLYNPVTQRVLEKIQKEFVSDPQQRLNLMTIKEDV